MPYVFHRIHAVHPKTNLLHENLHEEDFLLTSKIVSRSFGRRLIPVVITVRGLRAGHVRSGVGGLGMRVLMLVVDLPEWFVRVLVLF